MKTYKIHYALLFLLLFMASCVDDKMGGSQNETYSFTAQIEQDNSTRTTVNARNQVLWTSGDEIGIYGDQQTKNALFALQTANGTSAQFSGELKSGEQLEFAYYPYQQGAELNGNSLTFELPDEYVYTGNSNAPMIGLSDGKQSLSFKHLCGLMKVTVRDVPEESVRFVITSEGENPQPIAGTAVVDDVYAQDAILSIKESGDKAYTITYQLSGSVTNQEFTFFIPLPAGEYDKLTVSLRSAEDKVLYQKSTSDVRIKRAFILSMPTLSGDEDISYVLADNTVQMSRDDENYILSFSTEGGDESENCTLAYSIDTPEEKLPQKGQILLYSEITDKFPTGFLGQVTAVEQTNDAYIVHTEPATLSNTFDELYIDKELGFLGNIPDEVLAQHGIERVAQTKAVQDIPVELKIPINFIGKFPPRTPDNKKDPYAEISLSGGISIQSNVHLDIKLNKKERMEHMLLSFDNTTTTNITSQLSIIKETDNDESLNKRNVRDIFEKKVTCGKYILGPLVITPNFVYGISASVSGKGSITLETKTIQKSKSFLKIEDGKTKTDSPNQEDTSGETISSNKLSIDLEGKFALGPKAGVELEIFPVTVGLSLAFMGELGLEYHLDSDNIGNGIFYSKIKDSKATRSVFLQGDASLGASLFGLLEVEGSLQPQIAIGSTERYIVPSIENIVVIEPDESEPDLVRINYDVIHDTFWPFEFGLKIYDEYGNEVFSQIYMKFGTMQFLFPQDVGTALFTFTEFEWGKKYIARPFITFLGAEIVTDIAKEFTLQKNYEFDMEVLRDFYETSGGDNWRYAPYHHWFDEDFPNPYDWYGIQPANWEGGQPVYDGRIDIKMPGNNMTGDILLRDCDFVNHLDLRGDNPFQSLTLRDCVDVTEITLPGQGENLNITSCENKLEPNEISIATYGTHYGNISISRPSYNKIYFGNHDTNQSRDVEMESLEISYYYNGMRDEDVEINGGHTIASVEKIVLNHFLCGSNETTLIFNKVGEMNIRDYTSSSDSRLDITHYMENDGYIETLNLDQLGGPLLAEVHIGSDVGTAKIQNIINKTEDNYGRLSLVFNDQSQIDNLVISNVNVNSLDIHANNSIQNVTVENSTFELPGVSLYQFNEWDQLYDWNNHIYSLKNCTLKGYFRFEHNPSFPDYRSTLYIPSFTGTIEQLRRYILNMVSQ